MKKTTKKTEAAATAKTSKSPKTAKIAKGVELPLLDKPLRFPDVPEATLIAREYDKSFVVSAYAGAGKTTLLCSLFEKISGDAAFFAFNKQIVTELQDRGIQSVFTAHSMGLKIVRDAASRRGLKFSFKNPNNSTVFDRLYKTYITRRFGAAEPYSNREFLYRIRKLYEFAQYNLAGLPDNIKEISRSAKKQEDFLESVKAASPDAVSKVAEICNCNPSDAEIVFDILCNRIWEFRVALGFGSRYMNGIGYSLNFNDMIFLPAVMPLIRPEHQFTNVLIDECQDLSKASQMMLLGLVKPEGRFVAVGDGKQAINGFAGANPKAFQELIEYADNNVVKLPISRRCSKAVTMEAKAYVEDFECLPNAPEGLVMEDSVLSAGPNDMVIFRKYKPLVALAHEFISQGRKIAVKEREISELLQYAIASCKTEKVSDVLDTISQLKQQEIGYLVNTFKMKESDAAKTRRMEGWESAFQFAKNIIDSFKPLIKTQFEAYVNDIFNPQRKGAILLTTAHSAKGLEAEKVYVVNLEEDFKARKSQSPEMAEQETFLKYVAITRAKHTLIYSNY